jgi:uncharacterized protein (DUF4415 family)
MCNLQWLAPNQDGVIFVKIAQIDVSMNRLNLECIYDMAKKSSESSVRGARVRKSRKPIPDRKIDFSDIPELSDEQLRSMKRIGRPLLGASPRQMIAVRIDQEVLSKIRREAKKKGTGYQTLINEILAKYVLKKAA